MSKDPSKTNHEPEIVTALDETWSAFRAIFDGLDQEDWDRPTPCTDWSVKDLAAHLGAVEGQFQGLPQPPTPEPGGSPQAGNIDDWTAAGVEARRGWSVEQVLDEVERASERQLEHLRGLGPVGEEAWQNRVPGPVGETTEAMRADIRLMDLYVHLLDLRTALGRGLRLDAEPIACRLCTDRAIDLAGWGAVKKAGIEEGRVRLDLSGAGSETGGRTVDVVIAGGRGSLADPEGDVDVRGGNVITGPAPAFMLVAAGRLEMADEAGGVVAAGDVARRLLAGYRIFA